MNVTSGAALFLSITALLLGGKFECCQKRALFYTTKKTQVLLRTKKPKAKL